MDPFTYPDRNAARLDRPRVLVVDDEPEIVGIVTYELEKQGFEVIPAYDGQQALDKIEATRPDLVVLDVLMPKVDGFEVCRWVRTHTMIPVILLTVKDEDEDEIHGFELGADDYITKPFNRHTVVLHVQAVLRRSGWGRPQPIITAGPLRIDTLRRQVTSAGQVTEELTHQEFELLTCLARNAGRVLSWEALLKDVWKLASWEGGKEMVRMPVSRLRSKLKIKKNSPGYIRAVFGVGYKMLGETDCPIPEGPSQ